MRTVIAVAAMVSVVALAGGSVCADVFNMPSGQTSVEFVSVGHTGNQPDNTGYGSVGYEFNIGKFEVTTGQFTQFLNAVAVTDTYLVYDPGMASRGITQSGSDGSYSYSTPSDWVNRPAIPVDWGSAARFTNWLTNGQPTGVEQDLTTTEDGSYLLDGAITREDLGAVTRAPYAKYVIPTGEEWYKAAYYDGAGDVYYEYPTGSDTEPSNVLADPDPGNSANFQAGDGTYTIGSPYYTTPVGAFTNSASPYGTFDQGGNAFEWTSNAFRKSCS